MLRLFHRFETPVPTAHVVSALVDPRPGSEPPVARPREARSKPKPPERKALTPDEADLVSRLSPILLKQPRCDAIALPRQSARPVVGGDAPVIDAIAEDASGIGLPPVRDFGEVVVEADTPVPSVTWLRQRNKTRWRDRLQSLEAWLITVAVVGVIVCGASFALLGQDKSIALVKSTVAQASATSAVLRTLLIH
jgi:hypothetical protein